MILDKFLATGRKPQQRGFLFYGNNRYYRRVKYRQGYVALLSILIVGTIAAMTVIILFVTSLNTTLNSGDVNEGQIARVLSDGCVEGALHQIRQQAESSISSVDDCDLVVPPAQCADSEWQAWQPWEPILGEGSCYLLAAENTGTVVDGDGFDDTLWRIRATGTGPTGNITKYVEVDAYRVENDPLLADYEPPLVTRWVECVNFPGNINTDCTEG